MHSNITISLAIIVHNEEENLGACLAAAKDVVDEIIVIDSHSTDQTVEIARSFNAKVFQKKFIDFADQKNYAVSQCSGDYILSLDADEVLSETLKASILSLKRDTNPILPAYFLNRKTNYCGSWVNYCGWYPEYILRFWKKELGQWDGSIHETVKLRTEIKPGKLKGNLLHYSYKTIQEHEKKIERYTGMMAKKMQSEGKKGSRLKLLYKPIWSFFQKYILQLGILDGRVGLQVCRMSGKYTYLKYKKLLQLTT